jgi:uncharacterized membrane protein YhaH (DUF805 family)
LFWALFATATKRLHDTNRSGFFLWLILIPVIGPLVLIFLPLGTAKGTAVLAGFQFIPVISVTRNTKVCGGTQVPLTSSADANNQ